MKKFSLVFAIATFLHLGCREFTPVDHIGEGGHRFVPVKKCPGDLAVEWFKLQMRLSRTTTGFGPGLATRAFAYSGLTLYESIVEGIPGYQSVANKMIGKEITTHKTFPVIILLATDW